VLVLTRKCGQELLIGDNVRIVIFRCANGRCSVGVEAPEDVPIRRGELKPHSPEPPPGNIVFDRLMSRAKEKRRD
jgi:carbon storage regulator